MILGWIMIKSGIIHTCHGIIHDIGDAWKSFQRAVQMTVELFVMMPYRILKEFLYFWAKITIAILQLIALIVFWPYLLILGFLSFLKAQ
jgi:hypothetical protein